MQRKRIAIAAVAVAATGAAVAFTLPSMAGTTPSSGGASRTAAAGDVAPQLLAAMQRDLGLNADQARARLKRATWASRVSSTLAAQTGKEYAGAWLTQDGMTLKVAVTDKAQAKLVEKAGAEPVLAERSAQALDAAKQKLDEARAAATKLTGWYVDNPTNKVVVVAQPGETKSAWAFAEDAGLDLDDVSVKTAPQAKPLADVRGADPYIINGNARCSIGFAVEGGFVTAGHCGVPGDTTTDINGGAQGEVTFSVFPGDADMGVVAVAANFADELLPVVNDFDGNLLPVAGSTEAPVGAAICRSGSTTGLRCGVIQAKNQTVTYPEGAVTGLTQTDVCAEGGDSGGSWLSGDQAQGVTSGGSGDCTVGGTTFFQPVNEILATNDLTLLTSAGGQAPPAGGEEPPADAAGNCADLPINGQSEINRAGATQVQPQGGAFQANAGEQSACLQSPDGADFDLVLQQRTRQGFRTVATAKGENGTKTLTFNGQAGTYRYIVAATSGSGAYTMGISVP
ncbi:S1 family peptidase [Actinoplanes sp. NPDC049265]|uniref:S1 family peptidase n=1 Tax=Actinoplanes sp. NPDC049265 TaxID=3363902 RepID=UPI0037196DF6